ncbi:MAG TPA: MBL fold metallo-hydrolase [Tissierellaceae bacterium]
MIILKLIRIQAGIYAVNCYIIYSEDTNEGIIVDPGGDVDDILDYVRENNLNIKYLVLTHGHADHIGGLKGLKEALGAIIAIHEDDVDMLKDADKNLSSVMAMGKVELEPDLLLREGDILEFGNEKAKVIHTPGHTRGSICLEINDVIISGDTLFAGSIGRTDLYGGDYDTLINSIKDKLMTYPDETKVYPGHGSPTTIGRERKYNPFLR